MSFSSWLRKRTLTGSRRPRTRQPSRTRPRLERLEDRTLLSVLSDIPQWLEQGPSPISDSVFVGSTGVSAEVGKVMDIAVDPTNPNRIFIATASGGVWRDNFDDPRFDPNHPVWTPLTDGMPSNSMGGIAISPIDPNTIFAGTAVFSSFGGAGSPRQGIYRSRDGGRSWQIFGAATFVPVGVDIWQVIATRVDASGNPATAVDNEVVLAAGTDGIYRSTDGGVDWTNTYPFSPRQFYTNIQMAADPLNPNVFLTGLGTAGILRSSDGGATWSTYNLNIPTLDPSYQNNSIVELAVNTASGHSIYYAAINVQAGNNFNVYRLDTAQSRPAWVAFADQSPAIAGFGIATDPNNPNVIFLAGKPGAAAPNSYGNGARIFRADFSAAAGSQWDSIAGPTSITGNATALGDTAPHADSTALIALPNGDLLNADDGGIYRALRADVPFLPPKTIPTYLWISLNDNLRDTEFFSIAFDPVHGLIVGGNQDNGTAVQSATGSRNWDEMPGGSGDGGYVNVGPDGTRYYFSDAVLVRDTSRVQYRNSAGGPVGSGLNSTDKSNWVFLDGSGNNTGFGGDTSFYVAVNNDNPARQQVLLCMNDLYQSFDGGDTIIDLTQGLSGWSGPATFATYGGPNNPFSFYATASNGDLWGSFGTTMVKITAPPGGWTGKPVRVAVDPADYQTIYVLLDDGSVWQATNAGNSTRVVWRNLTGNLLSGQFPQLPSAFSRSQFGTLQLYNPTGTAGQGVLLVGGFGGVYSLRLGGSPPCWHQFGVGLPNVAITDLHFVRDWGVLVAATWGRGAWEIPEAGIPLIQGATLHVDADDRASNNVVDVRLDPGNSAFLQVIVDGITEYDGPYVYFDKLDIVADQATDSIRIEDIPACLSVTTESNGDITVGKNGSLQGILGDLHVNQRTAVIFLTIDDSADQTSYPAANPSPSARTAPWPTSWVSCAFRACPARRPGRSRWTTAPTPRPTPRPTRSPWAATRSSATWWAGCCRAAGASACNSTRRRPVAITTGPAANVFAVRDQVGAPALTLNARSDNGFSSTLDYSAFTTGVTVDLLAGQATGFTQVLGIQNVTGGAGDDYLFGDGAVNRLTGNGGNDVLVGGDGNDVLLGGGGRDLLIGGLGADVLDGGTGDDILIAGSTTYGTNLAALQAIMAEWTRTDLDALGAVQAYNTRIDHLRSGVGGRNGSFILTTARGRTTVLDDGVSDVLTGGDGLDWFFGIKAEATDQQAPEKPPST